MNKSIKLRTQLNSFTDDNLQFYVHVSPPRTVEREFSSPFFPPPPKKFPNVKLLKGNLAAFVLNGNFPNRQQIIWSDAYEVRAKREPKCGACGWGLGFRGVVRDHRRLEPNKRMARFWPSFNQFQPAVEMANLDLGHLYFESNIQSIHWRFWERWECFLDKHLL